jgi:DNA-binding NtrC family response regulator
LQEYDWPGNVRELRRAVERALVLCPHGEVGPDFVQQGKSPTTKIIFKEIRSMAEIDKEYILEVVRRKGGNLNAAARSLGISRSSLYRRLGEYGYKKGGEEE